MAPLNLQEVSDRIEIDDLLTRYATAVDTRQWDLYSACFTDDAFIDYTSGIGEKSCVLGMSDKYMLCQLPTR